MDLVPDVLTLNAWNHVVLTYGANQDGKGQFDLYVNGVPRGQQVLSDYPYSLLTTRRQGSYLATPGLARRPNLTYPANPFTGQIDEVLIYPYVLTEAQVDELYRNQADALHLPFDEPPGHLPVPGCAAAGDRHLPGRPDHLPHRRRARPGRPGGLLRRRQTIPSTPARRRPSAAPARCPWRRGCAPARPKTR